MGKNIDYSFMVGETYGRLTVNKINNDKKNELECICECGNKKMLKAYRVLKGHNISCGKCIRDNHGLSNTRLYNIWSAIKKRCNNPNASNYKDYGGRGIKMCDEWVNDFMNFYKWSMENGYLENLSIDRINVDSNYCPENCRWISLAEQQRNKRNNILYEIDGEKKTLFEWAREYNIKESTITNRIYSLGWDIEEALEIKSRDKKIKGNIYTINGKSMGLYGWAEYFGVSPKKVSSRRSGKRKNKTRVLY